MELASQQYLLVVISAISVVTALVFILLFLRLRNKVTGSRLNTTLREKHMLEQLFNNIPDRIYFKDRNSRFIMANKHVSRVMGENNPAKLINKTDFDFYDKKYAQSYFDDEQQIMKDGKPLIAKEEKGLDLDGNEIFVSTTKIPIKDRSGKVVGIIGIGRDITPQKSAEQELLTQTENLRETNVLLEEKQEEIQQMAEELNAQAENLREVNSKLEVLSLVASKTQNVVVIMDGNANFDWVNEGFEKHYELSFNEFIAKNGKNLRDNSNNENISAILNQIYITKKPYTYNTRYKDSKGKQVWSQTNISPILDSNDEIEKLILIDSDITDLKSAEERIKVQKDEIEIQAGELEHLNNTKDRLFSIIAHDLKNPFHSIIGFTDLLQRKYKDIDREKLKEYLDMMSLSTNSAYQLLENLLEWARAQTNRVKFKPENLVLNTVVDETVQLQSLHARNKGISLKVDIPEQLEAYADQDMIRTVIRNITSNAIKYTNKGGTISFSSREDEDAVHLSISDTGIGIEQEKIEAMFNLDEVSSTAGTDGETGTGLGLIVCNEFMKINQGTIEVESAPGKGSTFKLTLPKKTVSP